MVATWLGGKRQWYGTSVIKGWQDLHLQLPIQCLCSAFLNVWYLYMPYDHGQYTLIKQSHILLCYAF